MVRRTPSPAFHGPRAARALADVEVLEQDRIAELQNSGIGEARVGHVGVHGVGAVETRARRGEPEQIVS